MGNTLNYYRVMKETLLDQRKKRIGPNDFKRSRRAKRDTDRVSVLLLGAAILFVLSSTISAGERDRYGFDELNNIEPKTSPRAESWKRKCVRYFQFKEPRIIVYKDMAPTVWCMVESQKILRGQIPFDYKKDTK